MLVLSRKIDEKILIGEDIELMIVEIRGDTVKVGIKAPKDVVIFRNELVREVGREMKKAAAASVADLGALTNLVKKPK